MAMGQDGDGFVVWGVVRRSVGGVWGVAGGWVYRSG